MGLTRWGLEEEEEEEAVVAEEKGDADDIRSVQT